MEIYRPGMGKFSSQTLKSGEAKNSRPNSPDDPETQKQETAKKNDRQQRFGNSRGQPVSGLHFLTHSPFTRKILT
jgi:hypothetical protein